MYFFNENFFDSCDCPPPPKLSRFIIERNGHCLYSEYKLQSETSRRDFFCARYCFYIIYLTKVLGIVFKYAVWNFYYQVMQ